jgi:hypothetical protein
MGATRMLDRRQRSTIVLAAVLVAGCAQQAAPSSATAEPTASPTTAVASPEPSAVASTPAPTPSPTPVADRNPAALVPDSPYDIAIEPSDFSTTITNPYFPLDVGTTWTYRGAGERVVVTVTDQTRVIAGVTTIVVHDQAFEGSALIEDTEDYYAQDSAGNVWYFGEVTGECDGRKITSRAGSWLASVDGAQPGVVMLADPQIGDTYRQEYLAGQAEDQATILQLDASVSGPTGSYQDVLVTEDVTPLEPDLLEHKSYAPGVGVVQEESFEADPGVVRLIRIETGVVASSPTATFKPCRG